MAELLLGPLLRHVGTHDVTVWVETDAPCEVAVRCTSGQASGRTFAVAGHHYAILVLDGLPERTCEAYTVHLDGAQALAARRLGLSAERPAHDRHVAPVPRPVRVVPVARRGRR